MVALITFFVTVLAAGAVLPGGDAAAIKVFRRKTTPQNEIDQYLAAHNSVRAQHGAASLAFNQDLAAKAQEWANRCQFKHSGGVLGPFGENLAAGGSSDPKFTFSIANAIKSWSDEVKDFNPDNPSPSHFTQMVWKDTTEVGCAFQRGCQNIFPGMSATYYVCEYSPAGNVIGQFVQNVQA